MSLLTDLPPDCSCLLSGPHLASKESALLGTDETKGRFGEVTLETCTLCGRLWLHYFVEYVAFPESGRWYRGVISEKTAKSVTPETAVAVLEKLKWHLYGGSYFKTPCQKGQGPIFVDN